MRSSCWTGAMWWSAARTPISSVSEDATPSCGAFRAVHSQANDQRPGTLAVRDDEHLPLPVRPRDDRTGLPGGVPADCVAPKRQAGVSPLDALLRHAAADQ